MKDNSIRVYSNSKLKEKISKKAATLGLSASAYMLTLAEKDTRYDTKENRILSSLKLANIEKQQNEMEASIAKIKKMLSVQKEVAKEGIKPEDYDFETQKLVKRDDKSETPRFPNHKKNKL